MKTCDLCGTPAAKRYAVRVKDRIAMVGSSCARKFPRARTSDLIRSLSGNKAILAHGYATPPKSLSLNEFMAAFPLAWSEFSRAGDTLSFHRWKGYGIAWYDSVLGPRVAVWDPYQKFWGYEGMERGIPVNRLRKEWEATFPKFDPLDQVPLKDGARGGARFAGGHAYARRRA